MNTREFNFYEDEGEGLLGDNVVDLNGPKVYILDQSPNDNHVLVSVASQERECSTSPSTPPPTTPNNNSHRKRKLSNETEMSQASKRQIISDQLDVDVILKLQNNVTNLTKLNVHFYRQLGEINSKIQSMEKRLQVLETDQQKISFEEKKEFGLKMLAMMLRDGKIAPGRSTSTSSTSNTTSNITLGFIQQTTSGALSQLPNPQPSSSMARGFSYGTKK